MKQNIQLLAAVMGVFLCSASVRAAATYWDINGPVAGAGSAAPSGTWDVGATANWSTDSAGGVATTTWADNNDAMFSAGSDATGDFAIGLSGAPVVGDLTVEEGTITISGGTGLNVGGGAASKGVIDVALNSTLTINSTVTGGDNSGTITKGVDGGVGHGTLALKGANTYTGQSVLRVGTLSFNSIGNVNAGASALGNPADASAGTIKLGGSISTYDVTLQYTGSGHNSDRVINLAGIEGSITLDASGSGPIVFTSATGITVTGNGIHTLQFSGTNAGENTITGPIVNGINYTKVAKLGAGTWALLGNSTFTGVFDIRDGTVVINSIADQGSPSSIGTGTAGSQHAIIGFGSNATGSSSNATMKYIGSGHSSTRALRMYGVQGNPGGATIDASGTGPLLLYGSLLRPASTQNDTVVKILTLKGTNTNDNEFDGVIADWNYGGPIGRTFVTKDGPGKWVLGGNDTYTGDTTVNAGTLAVSGSGSIANSAVISVASGAAFDVSAVSGGFVVGAAQTLKGNGTVLGDVTANGTISPGASVGTLTFSNSLTLGGNLLIEVNKSLSPSNDVINVSGTLNNAGTGTVTVTNLGPALVAGDSFRLFNKAVPNGEAMTVVPAGGVVWTNKLALDGSVAVLSAAPPAVPAINLTIVAAGPTSFNLGGQGAASSAYKVYASTNVTTPMTNWWLLGTTNSNGAGLIQYLDSQATNKQRFYRFGQTVP